MANMKLVEALKLAKAASNRGGEPLSFFLAAGFNPLHLSTFLGAELSLLFVGRKIEIQRGLYGDLLGNIARLANADAEAGVVLLEWCDFDARLGVRSSAACGPAVCNDIIETANARASEIRSRLKDTAARMPTALSFPTLPVLPLSFSPGWQASSFEVELDSIVQSLRKDISQAGQVRILSSRRLDLLSPLKERWDIEADLLSGFPYTISHASSMAALLAQLVRRPEPKKGLITDLDDTLWRGIVGEVGVEGISWHLDYHSQMHAFYQRLLGALSAEGVLLGIASKNDPAVVEAALRRKDLALTASAFFPIEVSWGPKSEAVSRILKNWNIGADSVVFIDDSPLELAEVKASHPDVECIQFAAKDGAAIYDIAMRLRDLFGRAAVHNEDTIRAQSIRRSRALADEFEAAKSTSEGFLQQIQAEIGLNFDKSPLDPRALELINKTNQFNLNGKRFTEARWQNYFRDDSSFLLVASYTDKFGPLGKIAVIAGYHHAKTLDIEAWVMSCRAFSRRIEYQCLEELFTKFDVDEIRLDFAMTDRNGPLREFLQNVLGKPPEPGCTISRQLFGSRPGLVKEPHGVGTNG